MVVAIVLYLTFSKLRDSVEQISSLVGAVFSTCIAYTWGFYAYAKTFWAAEQVVPTVLLRDAVATTSAAGNAATYIASEIFSLQHHALATAHGAPFLPMAAPTAEVAKVERDTEKLRKKLEEYIPRELANLHGIREAMEHIIRDLAPQNNVGSQGTKGDTTKEPVISQKEKKHRGVVKGHLKELIKLVTAAVKHRDNIREDAKNIKKLAGYAGEAWEEFQFDLEELKSAVERRLIDTTRDGDSSSGVATAQEQKKELITGIEDLGRQVWLQHEEMKARRTRAERFATACRLESNTLRYLKEDMVLLLGRVTREEVRVEDAATRVLNVANGLIKSIEENYL
ncbi:hypothetical protein OQA88_5325 [Cercophora sp. LCS_1]